MEFTDETIQKTAKRKQKAAENANLLYAVASVAGMPAAEREAERLVSCSTYWEWDAYHRNKLLDLQKVYRCHSRYCPNCRAINAARIGHDVLAIIAAINNPVYHLTLTVPSVPPEKLKLTCDSMTRAFRRYWGWLSAPSTDKKKGYKKRPVKAVGALRSLEITFSERTRMFHPHYHVLVILDKPINNGKMLRNIQSGWDIRRKQWTLHSDMEMVLGRLWSDAYSGSPPGQSDIAYETTIQQVRDSKGVMEVVKYPAKESDFQKMDIDEFIELYQCLKNRRIRQAYGCMYNVAMDDKKIDMPEDVLSSYLHADTQEVPEKISTTLNSLDTDYHIYKKISRYKAHEGLRDEVEKEKINNDYTTIQSGNIPKSTGDSCLNDVIRRKTTNFDAKEGKININLQISVNEG